MELEKEYLEPKGLDNEITPGQITTIQKLEDWVLRLKKLNVTNIEFNIRKGCNGECEFITIQAYERKIK